MVKSIIKALALAALGAVGIGIWVWQRFGPGTYARFDTMFGKTRIYQVDDDHGEPVRLLEVEGIVHSGTYLDERYTELVFDYLKRYDVLFEHLNAPKRICVLGCGGYDYPEHLIANHAPVIVDAVEVDPAITELAKRYFYLDRLIEEYETEKTGRLNLICDDALHFLKTSTERYDAIVNDTFDAGDPPAHLTTEKFARIVSDKLVEGGLYLTNIVSPLEGPDSSFLNEQVALLESVFDTVELLPCAPDWNEKYDETAQTPSCKPAPSFDNPFTTTDNVIVIATKHTERNEE